MSGADGVRPELDAFLEPRHIVIVGGSPRAESVAGRPVAYVRQLGFRGVTSVVNPSHAEVAGFDCHSTIGDVPGDPDLAVVTVRASLVPDVIIDCGRRGIRSAIVFSSGFAETSDAGVSLQAQLRDAATSAGVRICGPNSLGLVSAPARLAATFATSLEGIDSLGDSGVSLVSQSGAMGAFIYRACLDGGTSLRYVVSTGNEVDLTAGDFLEHLVGDPGSRAIALCIENLRSGAAYLRALDAAAAASKPVILFRAGVTARGLAVARSHTGAIATDPVLLDAVSRQRNVSIARDLDDLVALLRGHAVVRSKLSGGRVAVVSVSGGVGVWAADLADETGVELAAFSDRTCRTLTEVLPAFASVSNPLDVTGQVVNDPRLLATCLATVVADDETDMVLVALGLQERHGKQIAAALKDVAHRSNKAVVIAWTGAPAGVLRDLRDAGLLVYDSLSVGLRATLAIAAWAARAGSMTTTLTAAPQRTPTPQLNVHGLTESDGKSLLAAAGIDVEVPQGRVVRSVAAATSVAREFGYPVVLKAQSDRVVHKAALGLVATDLRGEEQLSTAFTEMARRVGDLDVIDDPSTVGYLIEEQIGNRVELIVSVRRTPRFGIVALVGIGGVYAEALVATACRRAPLTADDIDSMLTEARIVDLLRCLKDGRAPVLRRLAGLIDSLCALMADLPELGEIELNPVAVTVPAGRMVALDAVVLPLDGAPATDHLRIGVKA